MSSALSASIGELLGSHLRPQAAAKIATFWLREYVHQSGFGDIVDTIHSYCADMDTKKLVGLIKAAETAERYEDMCKFVRKLVKMKSEKGEDLNVDERNLLSVAYKNVVSAKRASWRKLVGGFDDMDVDKELLKRYRAIVADELETFCMEVLELLEDHICKNVSDKSMYDHEDKVFYLKMCGDYYRYLGELHLQPKEKGDEIKANTEKYYKEAMEYAEDNLQPYNPTLLGLALNFSVCYYEILNEPEKACALAKKAFDDAIEHCEGDYVYKDSTLIMQLLRDNLKLWTDNGGQ